MCLVHIYKSALVLPALLTVPHGKTAFCHRVVGSPTVLCSCALEYPRTADRVPLCARAAFPPTALFIMAIHLSSLDQAGVVIALKVGNSKVVGRRTGLGVPAAEMAVSREHCIVTAFSSVTGQLGLQVQAKKRLFFVANGRQSPQEVQPGGTAQARSFVLAVPVGEAVNCSLQIPAATQRPCVSSSPLGTCCI